MFAKGRDFGAWLGMVPKQLSTGGRTILGKISKRGNKYLRTLFVQAARVVLLKRVSWERYGLKAWIEAAARGCIPTSWPLRLPTSSPASPGPCSIMAATSRSAVTMRPSLPEPGAVLGTIKTKPLRGGLPARLDSPCGVWGGEGGGGEGGSRTGKERAGGISGGWGGKEGGGFRGRGRPTLRPSR